jgi:ATP adenylyltransferase
MRDEAGRERSRRARDGRRGNPFLPYDEALLVRVLSETHVGLLNKFNVLSGHLLMVTRRFESQDTPLTFGDLEAFALCLREMPGLAFYNAGVQAGASQSHRHLQFVPLPLGPQLPSLPVEALIDLPGRRVRQFDFPHALEPVPEARSISDLATCLLEVYGSLRKRLALRSDDDPYNLLLTREWMLMAPRRTPRCEGVEVNAMAFAGSFFARSRDEASTVRRLGWLRLLADVTPAGSGAAGEEGAGA